MKYEIIDLLVDLYNNEEMPKKIMVKGIIYLFDNDINWYIDITGDSFLESNYKHINDEVEIIKEKEDKEDKEEKKIPEKIYWNIYNDTYTTNIYDKKCVGYKDKFKELSDMYRQKMNEIIDYLDYIKRKVGDK